MQKDIIIAYMTSKYSTLGDLKNFIVNYKGYKSGKKYKLIVCFKNLKNEENIENKSRKGLLVFLSNKKDPELLVKSIFMLNTLLIIKIIIKSHIHAQHQLY